MSQPAGLSALRYLKTLAINRGDRLAAATYAESMGWLDGRLVSAHLKATVSGLSSSDGLASAVPADLLTALRSVTVLGRLPGVRRLPMKTQLLTQLGRSRARWTAEGGTKTPTVGSYVRETFDLLKVAAVMLATDEVLRSTSFDVEATLLSDLLVACRDAIDASFLYPLNGGVPGEEPASITNLGAIIPTSGDLDADLALAIAQLSASGASVANAVWVMPAILAARLSLLRGASGAPVYPLLGGPAPYLAGRPVLTTDVAFAQDSDGESFIALIDGQAIGLAEGPPEFRVSKQATVSMEDPAADPPTSGQVSLFQANATALLAEVSCDWRLRVAGGVQTIVGVTTGEVQS
jgi:HK97 family phage major capsid protein